MEALALFNIGFRCENICQALKEYSEEKKFSKMIIEDSDTIINESFTISGSLAENMSASKNKFSQVMPLVFEALQARDMQTFTEQFTRIMKTIEAVKKGIRNVDVTEAIIFFKNLSNLCLSRNAVSQLNMSLIMS